MVMLKLEEQSPLIQAIFSGELDDVRILLTHLDVNYQDAEKRSPLHAAAFRGDKELAELLLQQGARVNTKDSKWLTPLHRACGVGADETVALLLSHNADTTARDRQWQTPLHIAAANNAVECVAHLLDHVPNVNVTDRSGRTALHHAAFNGHNDVIELLISRGCIINACDKKDCRPIHWAAHLGHVDTMELLIRNGADINVKNWNQYTPLHVAAASGMVYACKLLLHAGAEVNAQNSYGNNALHIACLNGHLPVCRELVQCRTNLEASNFRGQTPLHIAATSTHGVACLTYLLDQAIDINRQSSDGRTALHMSAIHGRFTRSKILIDKGAIIDCQDKNGNTALHIAAQYGHDILTVTLLEAGADPNKRGYEGRTPLHACCLSGFVEVTRKFIQINVNLNTTDNTGKTAVHCAAYKGSVECLDLLVSQGANFKLQDNFGMTPLHYAASQGHYTCVFTLVGIGAPVNIVDNEGCTPLHLAATYDQEGNCVEYLLQHRADAKLKDNRGFTPVHYAVNGGNTNALTFLLDAVGKNYNFQEEGMPLTTPLHLAARCGDLKILRSIIDYFPDVNIKSETGSTALLVAAREGHTHCVQMLLRYGAKVAVQEEVNGMTPVHCSARNGHMHCLALLVDNAEDRSVIDRRDKYNRTPLMLAITGSHRDCVLTLLKSDSDPNIIDTDGHSSLLRAVVTDQNDVVQLLISKGARIPDPDINGKTVLHLAARYGHLSCLQTVLTHMTHEQATHLDNQGFSALHWGCYNGNYTCVEYLLQKGVFTKIEGNLFSPVHCATYAGSERCLELLYNSFGPEIVKLRDARRRTPLHIASLHGHSECARYLLEQGAEVDSKDDVGRTALIAASQNGQSQIIELVIAYKANIKSCDNNGNTALHMACLKRQSHTARLLLEYVKDVETVNMVNNDKKTALHLAARNGLVDVTSNLIKKGSSVLAVDSNGLTPALCCAPNASVAKCLAIILAHHPIQCPTLNHSPKDIKWSKYSKDVHNLKQFQSHEIQTDLSLLRDPRELINDLLQTLRPDQLRKSLRARRRPQQHQSLPCLLKQEPTRTVSKEDGIILIERYDKSDGFDASFREAVTVGRELHRSFSEISLVQSDQRDQIKTGDCIDKIIKPPAKSKSLSRQFSKEIVEGSGVQNIYLALCDDLPQKNGTKRKEVFSSEEHIVGPPEVLASVPITAAESLTNSPETSISTQLGDDIFSTTPSHGTETPSTSCEFITVENPPKRLKVPDPNNRSLIHNRHVENYNDVFKRVFGDKFNEKTNLGEDLGISCTGDSIPNVLTSLMANEDDDGTAILRVKKKRCTCTYVCEKCVLNTMYDEPVIEDEMIVQPIVEELCYPNLSTNQFDGTEKEEPYPETKTKLTAAEIAAYLRDDTATLPNFGKINMSQNEPETTDEKSNVEPDDWTKAPVQCDRITLSEQLVQLPETENACTSSVNSYGISEVHFSNTSLTPLREGYKADAATSSMSDDEGEAFGFSKASSLTTQCSSSISRKIEQYLENTEEPSGFWDTSDCVTFWGPKDFKKEDEQLFFEKGVEIIKVGDVSKNVAEDKSTVHLLDEQFSEIVKEPSDLDLPKHNTKVSLPEKGEVIPNVSTIHRLKSFSKADKPKTNRHDRNDNLANESLENMEDTGRTKLVDVLEEKSVDAINSRCEGYEIKDQTDSCKLDEISFTSIDDQDHSTIFNIETLSDIISCTESERIILDQSESHFIQLPKNDCGSEEIIENTDSANEIISESSSVFNQSQICQETESEESFMNDNEQKRAANSAELFNLELQDKSSHNQLGHLHKKIKTHDSVLSELAETNFIQLKNVPAVSNDTKVPNEKGENALPEKNCEKVERSERRSYSKIKLKGKKAEENSRCLLS